MGYTKTQRARLEAGLCFRCGALREGAGSTNCFCAVCADKSRAACRAYKARHPEKKHYPADGERSRAWKAKRRAERLAAGKCVLCGKKRVERDKAYSECGACRRKRRDYGAAYNQRTRNRLAGLPETGGRNVRKWNVGKAAQPLGPGVHRFTCRLDRASKEALVLMKERYKAEERKRGREPKTHQWSRIVRDCVHRWERGPVPVRPWRLLMDERIGVTLDAKAWGILCREAARSGRSKAKVLRAMLAESAASKRVAVGYKNEWRLADYRARWSWEGSNSG